VLSDTRAQLSNARAQLSDARMELQVVTDLLSQVNSWSLALGMNLQSLGFCNENAVLLSDAVRDYMAAASTRIVGSDGAAVHSCADKLYLQAKEEQRTTQLPQSAISAGAQSRRMHSCWSVARS